MTTPTFSLPVPIKLGKKIISKFAEDMTQSLGFEIGSDLEVIVAKLGGKIQYQDIWELDSSESGSIVIESKNKFEITLAAHTSKARDRFTIAHELGHYFLHYRLPERAGKSVGSLRAARYGFDLAEMEANWFAASFLMPEQKYREIFSQLGGSQFEIAEHFGVSVSASRVRARSLGLIENRV